MKNKEKKNVKVEEVTTKTYSDYNVMVGFDEILGVDVKHALERVKIVPKIFANTYFYAKQVAHEKLIKLKEELKKIKFEFKKGTKTKIYKVIYVSATKCLDIITKTKAVKKLKTKTATVKNQTALTIKNLAKKAKETPVKEQKGNNHPTNYERKLNKRVKKAVKYIAKVESKKAQMAPKKAKSGRISKPIQGKLKFAA